MENTVVELFAGVGGFRVGFNEVKLQNGKTIEKNNYQFVWANQWEPSTKVQHAFDCYSTRFGLGSDNISNVDISLVDKTTIPDHVLLCGGFPCQDYSVARTLSKEKGIEGKKGVLWWQINEILKVKRPPFVLLENVDRLIKSPSKQKGRDFAIMLRCLNDFGYSVEWRVINAADYGHPQRRRRIYIFAYHKKTVFSKSNSHLPAESILKSNGIFAKTFPINSTQETIKKCNIIDEYPDLVSLSDHFTTQFSNAGYMHDGNVFHFKPIPEIDKLTPLKKIILKNGVEDNYFLTLEQENKFKYLRGSKKIERTGPNGLKYFYSEGSMSVYDDLSLPGRTMLTSEGSINRSTHIIKDPKTGNLRILTPVECERLNEFPDNWTDTGMPNKRRYFMMGNALVTGVIKKIGRHILTIIKEEK